MKLSFTAFLLSSLYSVDASNLRGDRGRVLTEDIDAKFLIADIDYDKYSNGNGRRLQGRANLPEQTFNVELEGGLIYEVVNTPPDWHHLDDPGLNMPGAVGMPEAVDNTPFSGDLIKIPAGSTILKDGKIDFHHQPSPIKSSPIKSFNIGTSLGGTKMNKGNLFDRDLRDARTPEELHRRLQLGNKSVLAVRVVASGGSTTASEDKLSDEVFGTSGDLANLVSQYKACSYDKLIFEPVEDQNMQSPASDATTNIRNGVMTVQVSTAVSDGDSTMKNAITSKINQVFGKAPNQIADYVMYCLPDNTMSGIAYAYINSWLSIYSDQWCNYLSAQMHEVGHNLGYGHSNENGGYQDQTGTMGYSYSQDDGPVMCFNAAKSHQTGWYSDEVTVVTPGSDGFDGCFDDQVYGVADYSNGQNDQTVIVRINDPSVDDYFVTYNRKTGINSGTVEGGDTVTVTRQGANGGGFAESELLAKLNVDGSYTISANDMVVKFIDTMTSNGVQSARVRISLNGEECEGRTSNPTNEPTTAQPTSTPTPMPPCQLTGGGAGVTLQVDLKTDNYPAETTWSLSRTCSGSESIASGSGYQSSNTIVSDSYCVQDGKFEFTINDSYGDGICCGYGQGNYSVHRQGTVEISGGEFGNTETKSFGSEANCDPSEPVTSPPSNLPTSQPSNPATRQPSSNPTDQPTSQPSSLPTNQPSSLPTNQPSSLPTNQPSNVPTNQPSNLPTNQPSNLPTNQPSNLPTLQPSNLQTNEPTSEPSNSPSKIPSANPTHVPTNEPTNIPTNYPTKSPTNAPSANPTLVSTNEPTSNPTPLATSAPTDSPTNVPTSLPPNQPSVNPTVEPLTSSAPTNIPTSNPTSNPTTTQPSNRPTPAIPLTDFPTSLQPTYLPTETPTTSSSPLEATTLRTLVCGQNGRNNNKCSANEQTVEKTTVQAVRCCRDESHGGSGGWPFKCRSDSQATYISSSGPWGQSRLGIIPDNLSGSLNGNCVETDFDGAVKTCEANNARLCTPQEMSDSCTRSTGCNFNNRLAWTCIAGGDGCSNDTECCSGTCGADGTCTAVQQPTVQRHGCCSWEGKDCSNWIPDNNPDCQYKQSDCENNCGGNWQLF